MSHSHNTHRRAGPARVAAGQPDGHAGPGEAQARLAHELANLLDGGLRNMSVVLAALRSAGEGEAGTAGGDGARSAAKPTTSGNASNPGGYEGDGFPGAGEIAGPGSASGSAAAPVPDAETIARLESVDRAMRQMALLVRRWTDRRPAAMRLGDAPRELKTTIEHAVALLRPVAAEREIEIEIEVDESLGPQPAGPLYTIVANAVRNSIEAFGRAAMCGEGDHDHEGEAPNEHRRVSIDARCEGGMVVLTVRDNGPGLEPAMFDADGEVRFGATTRADGHGLGLALCHEIAGSLGGTLTLANRRPRGAELTLQYPASAPDGGGAG